MCISKSISVIYVSEMIVCLAIYQSVINEIQREQLCFFGSGLFTIQSLLQQLYQVEKTKSSVEVY